MGINLFVLTDTLSEQCHRIVATFILKSRTLIFKGCKTKFSVDATQTKVSAIEGTFEQSRMNKESSSLHSTALPPHGIYFFLIHKVNVPTRSKLA